MALYPSPTLYPATNLFPCSSGSVAPPAAATQYLPLSVISSLHTFAQFSSTPSALAADLNAAFAVTAGFIQCFTDTMSGRTSNAVVVANDNFVLSVAPSNYVTYFNSQWAQLTPAALAAQFSQYFSS